MNNYIKIYDWMHPLPLAEQMVLAFIGGFGVRGCFLNNGDIALRTGLSPRSVSKALSHFCAIGLTTLSHIDTHTRVLTMAVDAEMRCNKLANDKAAQNMRADIANSATPASQNMHADIADSATPASQNMHADIAKSATLSYNIKETIKETTKANIKPRQEENIEKEIDEEKRYTLAEEAKKVEPLTGCTDDYVAMMEAWQQHWQEIKGVGYAPTAWTRNDIDALKAAFRLCLPGSDAIEVPTVVLTLRTFYTVADNWQRDRWDIKLIVKQFNQLYSKAYNYVNTSDDTAATFNINW